MLEQLSESAASPVLDLDPNLNACHGRVFTCKHAFSWGMPVVPLRNLCLSISQWCAAVVKPCVLQIQQRCVHGLLLLLCCSGRRLFSGQTGAPWAGYLEAEREQC